MCEMKIIVANFLFCHGTGYHLAHIPGIGLAGITSLNNVCKFERNNIFNNTESCKVQLHLKILINIFCLVNLKIWNKPNTTSQIISQSQMGQMELIVIYPASLTLVSIIILC